MNDRTLKETRIIRLCDLFKISIPSNLGKSELEKKYLLIDRYYRRYIQNSSSRQETNYDDFYNFVNTTINNQAYYDFIAHNIANNANDVLEMDISCDENDQNLLRNEHINSDSYSFYNNSDINMDEIILDEMKPINERNSLFDMEVDLTSNNDLTEIENESIPDEILVNQFRESVADDYNEITDDEIDFSDIYGINDDVMFENLQDNLIDENEDINANIVVNDGNITDINGSSDDKIKFIPINKDNFVIDHIVENTYGRSADLDRLTRNNELFDMLHDEENNVNDIQMLNDSTIQNAQEEVIQLTKKDKKKLDYIEQLENDFKNFNIINFFNLKSKNELNAIEFILKDSI
uniref:GIT domain-containing protein n=1 Tax=Strongyloides papillosus TaxID=174720 RepID=A0A0N5C735_STREA